MFFKFSFSLLSVSKLTQSFNWPVTFFPTYCVVQDLQTEENIGGGSERSCLYYFNTDISTSVVLQLLVGPY